MTVRLAPIEDWPDDLLAEASSIVGQPLRSDANVYRTLANHPKLFVAWLHLGAHLLRDSTLDARRRELIILRATANAAGSYPFTQHVRIGVGVGLGPAELGGVIRGPIDGDWADADRAILSAVDQLHVDGRIDPALWSQLPDDLDVRGRLDLMATVAFYRMAAWVLNTCRAPFDHGQVNALLGPIEPPRASAASPDGVAVPLITPLPVALWPAELLRTTATWPRFAPRPEIRAAGVYCTLANHPALFEALGPLMAHLLVDIGLSDRQREIVIVRACRHDHGAYPYRQHVAIAAAAGVDSETLQAIADDPRPELADPGETALIRLVDELHATNNVSDATWRALDERFDVDAILDGIATAGFYGLISFILTTAQIPLEPGGVHGMAADLPERALINKGA